MITKEGALTVDAVQLVHSLFALLPIPVAILDETDEIVTANSFFREIFPETTTLRGLRTHEVVVPGRGTYDLEIMPLNDQGFKVAYGTDISKEVSLRRQLTQLERRIQRGDGGREWDWYDLNDLVRFVLRAREPYIKSRKINLRLQLGAKLPMLRGDSVRIEKVLAGLIANAEQAILLAQRRVGAIEIKSWEENGCVRLSICDNGCGLGTRDMFTSAIDTLMRDSGQGRPIGLGLCAEILTDHGGDMFCWSSYDSGSTYTVELPIPASSNEEDERNPDVLPRQ